MEICKPKNVQCTLRPKAHVLHIPIVYLLSYIKATFSVYKLIPKNAQMTNLYTNWSLYITFTMIYYIIILYKNNFVKCSHHYLTSGGYQVCL